VELRQLRYFLAVSEELHFGRAALRLNVSQPPLSVAIRQLERELGVSLFDRTSRRVRLTDEGLVLKARAREILDAVDALSDLATSATAFDRGHLRVGFANSAGLTILPRTITSFRASHPRVELTLVELTSAQQVDALHDGSIDLGLLRGTDGAEDIATEEVLEEELVAAIPEGHPLATESPVGAGELAGEPLVFVSRRLMPGYFDSVMSLLRAGGTTPPDRPTCGAAGDHHRTRGGPGRMLDPAGIDDAGAASRGRLPPDPRASPGPSARARGER
jgi:DNA-binding transcriptional LysR family regulator